MNLANIDTYQGGWYCLGFTIACVLWFLEDLALIAAGKRKDAYISRALAGVFVAVTLSMMAGAM